MATEADMDDASGMVPLDDVTVGGGTDENNNSANNNNDLNSNVNNNAANNGGNNSSTYFVPRIVTDRVGPGCGFINGDEYHPILERPVIIQQTLAVDLGISDLNLNYKPILTVNNLALESKM
jgi:hypothetical protein